MTGGLYDQVHAVLAEAGRRLGVSVRGARLLRLHSNAIYVLSSTGLVLRIATSVDALARVAASVRVTAWLAAQGFPCVVPADGVDQPLNVDGYAVSVWRYVPTVAEPMPTAADLGRLLGHLHGLPAPALAVDTVTDPFDSIVATLDQGPAALSGVDRRWLLERVDQLRGEWRTLDYGRPQGLIHGDAHPNNLLRTADGAVLLGDWDHVAVGPREWDLIQVLYTQRRFGRPALADVDGLAAAYGWDVRDWPGCATLIAVREITGLAPYIRTAGSKPVARQELDHRMQTLRDGDTTARWTPPPRE